MGDSMKAWRRFFKQPFYLQVCGEIGWVMYRLQRYKQKEGSDE